MNSKRTTTIAAVLVTLSAAFAGSPLSQDSEAAKNDGRFAQSGEAKKAKLCNSLQGSYSDLSLIRDGARETGDKKGFSQARRDAERVKRTAIERGCDWA